MSYEYVMYLIDHITNVQIAYDWIRRHIPEFDIFRILPDIDLQKVQEGLERHDTSKYSDAEYNAYDAYFYETRTENVKEEFNKAWLHHIHNNPHHWHYWVLVDEDTDYFIYHKNGYKKCLAIDMPDNYIMEMICDWWSFSWATHHKADTFDSTYGLYEIFKWYDKNSSKIIFSENTQRKVLDFLQLLRKTLDEIRDFEQVH